MTAGAEPGRILVFGAGVLGSLHAAWLHRAGVSVTLLASGQRLRDIERHGVVLEDFLTGARSTTHLRAVDRIPGGEAFDLCLVLVQKTQLDGALRVLAGHPGIAAFVFMNNTAGGPAAMVAALGRDRVLMGHAKAGGKLRGHVVRYVVTERMTLGEIDGARSPRIEAIAAALRRAGFATDISRNVDAWKRYHVALAVPLALAMARHGNDRLRLARDRRDLRHCLRAMRECFAALEGPGPSDGARAAAAGVRAAALGAGLAVPAVPAHEDRRHRHGAPCAQRRRRDAGAGRPVQGRQPGPRCAAPARGARPGLNARARRGADRRQGRAGGEDHRRADTGAGRAAAAHP